ncbi:MAG: hypothetical protein ABIG29_00715 [Candidatus Nealsonbacteria bacterium]
MSKEFYIRLTLGVYKVSQLFPEKESLKTDLRTLADEILAGLLCDEYQGCSENIKLIQKLFDLAESRGLADPRNFSVLRREYAKVGGFVEDAGVGKNKRRRGAILDILKNNSKVRIGDLIKSFPDINRRTILRDMDAFCHSGAVERNGSGRGACYTIRNATL